ncbi:type II toxin-antitoxin system Phd/YefM family antitoxin [Herbaspirillum sp. BH-1]|uniref:Antitoxin n=1 Tax=Herbaspirillum frisingense TaxID=92645 RepID=A0ABU1PIS7_9BURK|nr:MULTISPECIES: type II toxin-antitoxin system Phd/YefM family antitoxin [Herbaspirillum]MDR6585238.1 PHD/YefM family antitoxin component YafN of YafNO toxin-antitoxin module [Herbaspirillum frisingense]PLY59000.1 type II toxin-antitoxin system Phd/YefM family antitoxin [Herbaspirillum sp. BH-1]
MYAYPVQALNGRLDELLELADIDEVILTRDNAENLVLVRESVWRGVQEALHLLGNDLNAERLLCSLQQLRATLLSGPSPS